MKKAKQVEATNEYLEVTKLRADCPYCGAGNWIYICDDNIVQDFCTSVCDHYFFVDGNKMTFHASKGERNVR